jgi:hypothetical protein
VKLSESSVALCVTFFKNLHREHRGAQRDTEKYRENPLTPAIKTTDVLLSLQ